MSMEQDYEHWTAEEELWTKSAAAAGGYDSNNGLRRSVYRGSQIAAAPAEAVSSQLQQPAPQPRTLVVPHQTVTVAHLCPQHCPPYSHYIMPSQAVPQGFYTYVQQPSPGPMPQAIAGNPGGTGGSHVYHPTYNTNSEPGHQQPVYAWMGRTRAQVDEDNMMIAKKEGAYDKRQVEPVGLPDDQMLWVVETDGSNTLRTFASIKQLDGDWKQDPRFEDSWYFVRKSDEPATKKQKI